jgi:hypothetical protein
VLYHSSEFGRRLLKRKLDANTTAYEENGERNNGSISRLAAIHLTFVSQPVGLDIRKAVEVSNMAAIDNCHIQNCTYL